MQLKIIDFTGCIKTFLICMCFVSGSISDLVFIKVCKLTKAMKSVLVINFRMPTIVGILKSITKINDIVCDFKKDNCLICLISLFENYE